MTQNKYPKRNLIILEEQFDKFICFSTQKDGNNGCQQQY